jgi:membrane-bound metal-dependent hydrolase YbcI (DUF457 family)
MPSPIGHALGGLAAGWLVLGAPRRREPRDWPVVSLALAGLAVAPDLDLLTATHRGITHSVGAALITVAVAWLVLHGRDRDRAATRLAFACGAAWGSHVLLDWLGTDTWAPVGVMALWPISAGFYESPLHLFLPISRRIFQPELFWIPNLRAVLRELILLGPLAFLSWRGVQPDRVRPRG